MKITRILTAGAALALISTSTLLISTGANADPGTDYVTGSQFVAEASPYPAQWFTANVAGQGSITSGLSGLTVVGNELLLNGMTPTTGLVGLAATASLAATGPAAFQISVFGNFAGAGTGPTTLVPTGAGTAGLHSEEADSWLTTQVIMDSDGVTPLYLPGATATLDDFEAALSAYTTPYQIRAYGVSVLSGSTVLHSITWNDVTSQFTPAPTATLTPSSITPADVSNPAKGITAVFTGYAPGESVQFGYGAGNSGGEYGDPVIADATGTATFRFVWTEETPLAPGDYSIGGFGTTSNAIANAAFVVVAAAVVDPALAATGANAMPYAIGGGILLLLGVSFGGLSLRRRAAQRN